MRKNAKERKITKAELIADDNTIAKLVKIVIVVAIVYLIFYLITLAVKNKKEETAPAEIQYTEIVVGSILNRPVEEYLVLVTTKDDKQTYNQVLETYNKKESHLTVYKVDLTDGFNEKYVSDTNNLQVDDISKIKFSTSALLKIKNKKIVETITESSKIESYLQ